MADLGGVFDATKVAPMGDRSPIPAGDYRVACVKSDFKDSSKGGKYLEFTWQILEGQYANRMLWTRLSLRNSNPVTVQIAEAELSSICAAAGIEKLLRSEQVHDIPLVVSVVIKPRKDTGQPSNSIAAYRSVRAASEAKQAVPVGAGVTGEAKPSWM